MYPEELPEEMPFSDELSLDRETAGILNGIYPIRFDHNTVVKRYADMGRPFEILPFRSTVYVRETGENISGIAQKEKEQKEGPDTKRFHPVAMLRRANVFNMKLITKRVKREFGIGR